MPSPAGTPGSDLSWAVCEAGAPLSQEASQGQQPRDFQLSLLSCFLLLFFSQLFVRPPQTAICFFAFLFLGDDLDSCLLHNVTNLCP